MKIKLLSISAILLLLQVSHINAQSVEEIIVTATKTEKTLQEVPVAVSVVSADTIEKANITDMFDLKALVPSLDTRQYNSATQATFFIRGFGNGSNNPGVEPSVALFIDGVYRSSMQSQISDLPVIERIEVLRGPQSTLFGKNASAGVINIVTKKPSFEKSGYISSTIGNFNTKKVKSYLTGPLNETTAFSLSANVHQSDGHTDNLTTGSDINNRDRFGLRGELLFQPSEDLSVRITADYDEYDEICCAIGSTAYGQGNLIQAAMGGRIIPNNVFTQKVFFDFDPTTEGDNSGISMHIKKDFGGMTLESISALRNTFNINIQDVDFDGGALVNPSPISNDRDAVSQEFRLYSNNNKKFNWLIGGYYFQEDMAFNESIYLGPLWRNYIEAFLAPGTFAGLEFLLGLPTGSIYGAGQGNTETASQDNETTSLFMQFDYNFTDRLNALFGVSYIEDKKTVSYNQVNTAVLSALDFVAIGTGGLIAQGIPASQAAVLALNPTFNPLLGFGALQVLPTFANFPNAAQDGKTQDDNVDYTFKLTFGINDYASIYGGISTGYKSSAWIISRDSRPDINEINALAASGSPIHPNVARDCLNPSRQLSCGRYAGPEEAEVMEIGAKIYLPSGYLNIAVFDQEIKGFQSNTFVGTGFVLANAGTQSVDGYEFDLLFSPTENIDIALGGTFIDPIYDSFANSAFGNLSGTVPSNTPDDTISTSVTWNWDRNGWDGYLRLSHLYSSEAVLTENPAAQALLESKGNGFREQDTLNFSVGIEKDNLSISLWGKNINNDEYITSVFPAVVDLTNSTFFGYPNDYATYGLTVNYSF